MPLADVRAANLGLAAQHATETVSHILIVQALKRPKRYSLTDTTNHSRTTSHARCGCLAYRKYVTGRAQHCCMVHSQTIDNPSTADAGANEM
jgi:hypothetical protein